MGPEGQSFDAVKARLEAIAEEVAGEGISLEEALSLYEEAVALGLAACDLSEQDALEAVEAEEAAQQAVPADAPEDLADPADAPTAGASAPAAPSEAPAPDGPGSEGPSA